MKIMKKFLYMLLVCFCNLICWMFFGGLDETILLGKPSISLIVGFIPIVIVFYLYIKNQEKLKDMTGFSAVKLNIISYLLWIVATLLMGRLGIFLVDEGLLHNVHNNRSIFNMLYGFEYVIYVLCHVLALFTLGVIQVIDKIFLKKKKTND